MIYNIYNIAHASIMYILSFYSPMHKIVARCSTLLCRALPCVLCLNCGFASACD